MTHTGVVDLGYGDAGKGAIVDWLCSTQPVHAVVRFNGGAQAAHNVVRPDGRHHTFAQFGSGTFTAGVRTHLSRFMLVEPFALAAEARHLAALGVPSPLSLLSVDREALLTTPYHRAANQARELARGAARHGSCGIGIGETMEHAIAHPLDAPRAGDAETPATMTVKLNRLLAAVLAAHPSLTEGDLPPVADVVRAYRGFADRVKLVNASYLDRLLDDGDVVFEGAQGVLLDEWRGFHPHTTWSTTTFDNAETLLAEAGRAGQLHRLGVLRTYTTRHGNGPFVTEDDQLTRQLPDAHNGTGRWQGGFRTGHFDAVAHRYALEVCGGVDAVALTHLDVAQQCNDLRLATGYTVAGRPLDRLVPGPWQDLDYQQSLTDTLQVARPTYGPAPTDWVGAVSSALGVPVEVGGFGPRWTDKRALVRPTPAAVPTPAGRPSPACGRGARP